MNNTKIALTFLLDVINADTKVILTSDGKIICNLLPIYEFSHHHELDEYYGNYVKSLKSIGKNMIAVEIWFYVFRKDDARWRN